MPGELVSEGLGFLRDRMNNRARNEQLERTRREVLEDRDQVTGMFDDLARRQENVGFGMTNRLIGQSNDFYRGRDQAFSDQFDPIRGGLVGNLSSAQHAGQGILGGFQDRFDRGMRNLEGAGDFERGEINRQFDNRNRTGQAGLIRSGLSGSTISQSFSGGNERLRSNALGGLNERLRRERADLDARLSGDALNARIGQQGFMSNLGFNTYGALGRVAEGQLNSQEAAFAQEFANRREMEFDHLDRRRSNTELRARPFENTIRQPV